MSKLIQFPSPNSQRLRAALRETISMLTEMTASLQVQSAHVDLYGPGGEWLTTSPDPEPYVVTREQLLGIDDKALAALIRLVDEINGTIPQRPRVDDAEDEEPEESSESFGLVDTDLLEVLGSRDGIRGWLDHSELTGEGPRPVEFLTLDSLTLESIENSRRVIAIGSGVGANNGQGKVRVVTNENIAQDIEQYSAPMRGTWEWLEPQDSE